MADRQYMEEQGIEKALADALAKVIREKPKNGLRRIAELISPETFVDPSAAPAPPAAATGGDAPPPPPAGDAPPPPADDTPPPPPADDTPPPPPPG